MPPKFKSFSKNVIYKKEPPTEAQILESYVAVEPFNTKNASAPATKESAPAPAPAPAPSPSPSPATKESAPAPTPAPSKESAPASSKESAPAPATKESTPAPATKEASPALDESKEEPLMVPTTSPSEAFAKIEATLTKQLETDIVDVKVPVKFDVKTIDAKTKAPIVKTSTYEGFIPSTRKAFSDFMITAYHKYYLKAPSKEFDPKACEAIKTASKKEQKAFAYQNLIRDYMQRASPFRGVLVNHGLGSGKTCTSIATMEALMSSGPVFILTPASLRPNYVGEIQKCGPFLFRYQNHWEFLKVPSVTEVTPELAFLLNVVKVSKEMVAKRKGAWIPVPNAPANVSEKTPEEQDDIKQQLEEHIAHRFTFIHYNGLLSDTVRSWACNNPRMFDGATIVIDEIHNLIRMINNSGLEKYYETEPPSKMINYIPPNCKVPKKYRPAYLLYRMLKNAVGAKIIGLSATPIINVPQELGILANLLGGDIRMIETTTPLAQKDTVLKALKEHPEVDFVEVITSSSGKGATVRFTPVQSGFKKLMSESGECKGFLRDPAFASTEEEMDRERNLSAFFDRIKSSIPDLETPILSCKTRFPDLYEDFTQTFIDVEKLEVKEATKFVMMSRLSGLISYFKGENPNMMAKSNLTIHSLDMSDLQLSNYASVRDEEMNKEKKKDQKQFSAALQPSGGSQMYSLITKTNQTFKVYSRAACNFVFPSDMDRPRPTRANQLIDTKVAEEEDGEETDEEDEEEEDESKKDAYIQAKMKAIAHFRENGETYFSKANLPTYSPKYQKILDMLEASPGSALLYSQFLSLEGLIIFSIALEHQQGFARLDIETSGGEWRLKESTRVGGKKPFYIQYTGSDPADKRKLLLAIFNAQWDKIPSSLAEEVKALGGQDHNKDGGLVKVFMITQSGAEGISLSNVRQVHIMEPYWNKVRTNQVIGRAIRICSHADLDPKDRTVDTYYYIMKFSKAQLDSGKVNQTLQIRDTKMTTDEIIMKIADSKEHLNNSLLNVMKASAIDCTLNKQENGFTEACYFFPGTSPVGMSQSMDPLFHPDLAIDLERSKADVRAKK